MASFPFTGLKTFSHLYHTFNFFSLREIINSPYYLLFLYTIFEDLDVPFTEIQIHIIGARRICNSCKGRFSNNKCSF